MLIICILAWPLTLLSTQNQTFLLDHLFREQTCGWLCSEKEIFRINVKDFKLQISLTPPWKQGGHKTTRRISKIQLGFKPSHRLFQMTLVKYFSLCLRLRAFNKCSQSLELVTQPACTQPAHTQQACTQPAHTQPACIQPAHTQPACTHPAHTQPACTQPAHSQHTPSKHAHSQPAYTQPAHSQPACTQPRLEL